MDEPVLDELDAGSGMEFRILGPLEVLRDGNAVDLGRRRQRALLALLLLHPNQVVPSDRLIEELWGESAPPTASSMVQVSVSRLRKALGVEGVLLTRSPGYLLKVDTQELDALRFERLVRRAREAIAGGDPAGSRELISDALRLWRGRPLLDFTYESFAQGDVGRLEELRLEAVELQIEARLALRMDEGLVAELEQLVEEHPFRERLRGQLMLALYRSGRQAEALAAYRAARTKLVEELGLEPSPALQQLEQSILAHHASLDPPPVERARATPGQRHNLPTERTSLIGRERETGLVAGLLADHRLVTLVGPGGVGKTRVAQRVATTVSESIEDGAWFVDLAAIDRGTDVPGAIMSAAGIADRPRSDALDTVVDALRDRSLLLVLDNCEHVLAGAALAAERLLTSGDRVRILATSREPLGVVGERVERLEPLATSANGSGAQPPAIVLFLDRAAMHGAKWEEAPSALSAVREVCQRLDGIPLAIELAAARTGALSPSELLKRLDDRLRLLARPGHWSSHARQQTLEATIAWSYALLTEDEQATLRRLAVFRGGFTLAAAVAVCADVGSELDAVQRITALVDRSVVTIERREDSDRYRLLESIWLFAELRLRENSEHDAARDRHARFFLELLEDASTHLDGPHQALWAKRLDVEEDNMTAALDWCLDGAGPPMVGGELAARVGSHWTLRGRSNVARRWLERAAEIGPQLPAETRVAVHLALFSLGWSTDDDLASARNAIEATRIARQCSNVELLGEALARLAASHQASGDDDAAAAVAAELRDLEASLPSPKARTRALVATADVALAQGDPRQAAEDAARARELARGAGDHRRAAASGLWLGYALALCSDMPAAKAAMHEATRDAVRSGYEMTTADTVCGEAELALAGGELQTTSQLLLRAAEMLREQQRLGDFGGVLHAGALLELKRGHPDRSAELLGAAMRWMGRHTPEFQKRLLLPELAELPEELASQLGSQAFVAARDRGAALTPDEAAGLLSRPEPDGRQSI